jgi:uncharacterized protein (TIGR03435 family)
MPGLFFHDIEQEGFHGNAGGLRQSDQACFNIGIQIQTHVTSRLTHYVGVRFGTSTVCSLMEASHPLRVSLNAELRGCVIPGMGLPMLYRTSAFASTAALIFVVAINVSGVRAQSPGVRVPKWEAASIKRCNGEQGGEQDESLNDSSNRIRLSCYPVSLLIQDAYVLFAGGHWTGSHPGATKIEHLPEWGTSERYTVEAKAEGSPGQMTMPGPMLEALLVSRFALRIHPETTDEPAYALTLAKSGLKVQPFKGTCVPEDPLSGDPTPLKNTCPRNWQDFPMNLDTFAWWLTGLPRTFDATVINKTGIAGHFRFNFRTFQMLNPPPFAAPDQVMESARGALRDIGLNLVVTKAPRRHLVVDHLERPSAN